MMFAVIMGVLYTVFSAALKLRETAYEAFEKDLPKDYVVEIIRRDLANIMLPTGILAGPMVGEMKEEGNFRRDYLKIHTASGIIGDRKPWGDVQRIEYYLEQAEDSKNQKASVGQNLVRATTRNLLAPIEEDPETENLLQDVQSLQITYYYGQDWLDSWDSATRQSDPTDSTTLPLAIKVRIDFLPPETGKRETLPIELVVPIVTTMITPKQEQTSTSGGTSGGTSGRTSGGTSGGTPGGTSGGTSGGKK
jgi:hypothetical protein